MNSRLSTIAIALAIAAAGTLAVFWYVRGADARALEGKKAVDALVAADTIAAGTPVSELRSRGLVKAVRLPAGTVPADALRSLEDDGDLVIRTTVAKGELLRRPLMSKRGSQTAGLSVPDGKIAVTVALGDPQRVAGYVRSGSRIAVFVTVPVLDRAAKPRGDLRRTKLLMSNIEVLSVGSGQEKDDRKSADVRAMVTVAVTQSEAEKLIQAGGDALHLALQTDSSRLQDGTGVDGLTLFE